MRKYARRMVSTNKVVFMPIHQPAVKGVREKNMSDRAQARLTGMNWSEGACLEKKFRDEIMEGAGSDYRQQQRSRFPAEIVGSP